MVLTFRAQGARTGDPVWEGQPSQVWGHSGLKIVQNDHPLDVSHPRVRFKGLGANAVLSEIPLTLTFMHDLTGPWSFALIPNGPLGAGPPWPTSPTTAQLQSRPPPFPTRQPQGTALKPSLQIHNLGIGASGVPRVSCPNHTAWLQPGGRASGRLQVVECRRGATCCQGAAPGGGHTHKAPVLLPAALPPGNQEPCSDFPREFPVLWPLLLPKPLCPLLPGCLCLHKHLKPRSLGALRAAILNPSAHSQPANSRVLPPSSRPLARTG